MKALSIFILIWTFFTTPLFVTGLSAHQTIQPKSLQSTQSSSYFRQAFEEAKEDREKIRINRLWAEHYLSANKKDSAIMRLELNLVYDFSDSNPDLQPALARSYVLLDRALDNNEQLETAVKRLTMALPVLEAKLPNSIDLSWAYLRYGIRLWYSEKYEEAEVWWQRAYQHSKKLGHRAVEIKALHHQGFTYTKNLKLKLSQSHYKYLISLIESSNANATEDHILALNALGSAFNWDETLDSALHYYQKGLKLLEWHESDTAVQRMVLTNRALIKNNIGKTYLKMKDYVSATNFLEEAISINEQLFGNNSTELIRSLRDLGKAYQFRGYEEEAKTAFLRALDISKLHKYDLPKSYSRLADYYAQEQRFSLSLLYYDSATVSTGTFLAITKDQYIHGVNLYTTIYGHSGVLANSNNVDIDDLNKLFDRFNNTLQFFYGRIESETFFQWVPLILENLYLTYAKLHDQNPDRMLLDRLWEITELNKAVKLRKQLNKVDAFQFDLPSKVVEKGKMLRNQITELMTSTQPGDQDSTLFFMNREYDEYLKALESEHPRYYALKNKLETTPLSKVKRGLKKGTMLINFLEGKEQVYTIRITGEEVTKHAIGKKDLITTIANHNAAILTKNSSQIKNQAEKLRKQLELNASDIDHISHFHIIPDGLMWNLNFAAVMNIDHKKQRDKYSFSFNYFAGNEPEETNPQPGNMLAFAYSEPTSASSKSQLRNSDETASPIPGTSAELASISKLWDGEYYYAQNANETTFRQKGGKYGLLHLAIHGFMNQAMPENSYLQFAAPDSLNDGKLHVYEIYNLDLNADLAVLSACHSGQGKVVTGEGMMSLGRAFAYAGVRSLLISRWEVSDYSAPHLMKYFYQGLKEGMYKSEALNYAQAKYLDNHSDALTSSPFYWSSFYVLGDDSPIYQSSATFQPWMIWWLLLALVLSVGIAIARRQIKRV